MQSLRYRPDTAWSRWTEGDDHRRRVRRVHREPARGGDVRAGPGAGGYSVERQFDLRSREISQNALESGQIDLKPEYLSSLLLFLDPNAQASDDPASVARQDGELLQPREITVLTPSPAHDTNEFVANAQTARRFDLTTMSSLAPVAGQLTFGGPPECPQRPFCLPGLNRVYGVL